MNPLLSLLPILLTFAPATRTVAPGVTVTRELVAGPAVVHVARLDPAQVDAVATPANGPAPRETTLQSTRAFLDERPEVVLAANVAFFRLPDEMMGVQMPFADVHGAHVSDGEIVSPAERGFPAVEITRDGRLIELPPDAELTGRHVVVAGSTVLVRDGLNVAPKTDTARHPRTALAATADGTLLVLVVDGRQPGVSAGVTQWRLAELLIERGASFAVNLDGGGSSTLVARDAATGRGTVLNVPVGLDDRPGTERPVGSNLGFVTRQ